MAGSALELHRIGQIERKQLLEFFDHGDALLAEPDKHPYEQAWHLSQTCEAMTMEHPAWEH